MNHRQPVFYQQTATGWTPPRRRSFQALKLNDDLQQRMKDAANRSLQVIGAHRLFILLVLTLVAAALGIAQSTSSTLELTFSLYHRHLFFSLGLLVVIFLVYRTFGMMWVIRPQRPLAYLIDDIRRHHLTVEKITLVMLLLSLFPLFSSAFTYCKSMIPVIKPFTWDPYWVNLDRTLHFGVDPWRLLHPWLGYAPVTRVVNVLYNLWMFFWYVYFLYIFFSVQKERVRMQFLISFILVWGILGVMLATVFSSAGPCFFAKLYPETPYYGELMAYLHNANDATAIWAVSTQNMLWQKYQDIAIGVASGISAMPSMHVAITILVTLSQFQINRKIGLLFLAYTLVIMAGSVHLAWHYAIDGYLSVIVTYLIWHGVGKFLKRYPQPGLKIKVDQSLRGGASITASRREN